MRLAKEELEKQLRPLWLVHFAVSKLKGESYMSYSDFLKETISAKNAPEESAEKAVRTASEIEAELMQFVEMDRKKGG